MTVCHGYCIVKRFPTENMVKGLDEDESHFLDEVSRQQSLVEKQRRDEEQQELREYRISLEHARRHAEAAEQSLCV